MKSRKSERRRRKNSCGLMIMLVCIMIAVLCALPVFADEKWQGVDESVVKKVAKEHGREAWEPFINTDQGDLLLFVFLVAGTIGGFAAGYYWRVLIERRPRNAEETSGGRVINK